MNKADFKKDFVSPEKLWRQMEQQTFHPQKAQSEILREILATNAKTIFGAKHKFSKIKTPKDYRARVPIHTFEDLERWIEAQDKVKKPVLTEEQPRFYLQSSGTTGRSKFIPVLENTLAQAHLRSMIFNHLHFQDNKFGGRVLSIVGAAVDGKTPGGTPCGSYSGLLYKLIPEEGLKNFVLPKIIFEIPDCETKYLLIAAWALLEQNIGVLVAANPAVFQKLLSVIHQNQRKLLRFVRTGTPQSLGLGEKEMPCFPGGFKGNIQRAKGLEKVFTKGNGVTLSDLWPGIHTLVTWTGGSCGVVLASLKRSLPSKCRILEMGYLASEMIGTITVDGKTNAQIPFLSQNFYEFIEPLKWEKSGKNAKPLDLAELQAGKKYFVVVTTQTGLYRYFINDLVEVTGTFHNTPTLKFLQKGKGVLNISGELLYEGQVISAINSLNKKKGLEIGFFLLVGFAGEQRYKLFYEKKQGAALKSRVFEEKLAKFNAGIEAMRGDGTLRPTEMIPLKPGAGEAYKRHCLEKGQKEAQFKFLTLQDETDVDFDFEKFCFH